MSITPGMFVVRTDGPGKIMRVETVAQNTIRTYDNKEIPSTVVSGVVVVDGYHVAVVPAPLEIYRPATEDEIASARETGELP
jgi:hypothetical protein